MEKDVLGYWEAIELVKPAEINVGSAPFWPERRSSPIEFQLTAQSGAQLPWTLSERPEPRPGHDILYTAFLGLYDTHAYNAAAALAGTSAAGGQRTPFGVLSLLLGGDGRVLPQGSQIASTPWALARLRQEGPAALDGGVWESLCRRMQQGIDTRWAGGVPAFPDLQAIVARVLEVCGSDLRVRPEVRIKTQEIPVPGEKTLEDWVAALEDLRDEPEQLFTSRFYGDIAQARGLTRHPVVSAYVTRGQRPLAVDAIRDRETLLADLDPVRLAAACWPTHGHRTLNLAQRFTLQRLRADLAEDGLFAVNGPPGTGKTTLIRELAVDLVTQRARAMTRFRDPERAFADGIPPEITGYEMTVCTQSNRAAQRVSVELPRTGEVDPLYAGEIGLFRCVRTQVASAYADIADVDLGDIWGTFALPLGRHKLRKACAQALWPDPRPARRAGNWTLGRLFFQDFEEGEADLPEVADWETACARFRAAEAAVGQETEKARCAYRVVYDERRLSALTAQRLNGRQAERAELARLEQEAKAEQGDVSHKVAELEARVEELREAVRAQAQAQLARLRDELANLEQVRRDNSPVAGPEAYHRWTDAGRRRSVVMSEIHLLEGGLGDFGRLYKHLKEGTAQREADRKAVVLLQHLLSDEQKEAFTALEEWRETAREAAHRRAARTRRIAELRSVIDTEMGELDREIARLEERLAEAQPAALDAFGANAIDAAAWEAGGRDLEMAAPWVGEPGHNGEPGPLHRARVELFLAALQVHEAFLMAARRSVRGYLQGFFAMLRGESGWRELYGQGAPTADLWRVFFLCVPVVSTTFHSIRRLFAGVGPQAFGWSIIDEAGQAEPQAAVGALLRSRRTVVLGDPLQLEPISEVPDALADRLAERLPDSDDWDPRYQSVQTLADRRAAVGAVIHSGGQQGRRVGCPLRVHWRCDEPMASLSARIAYGDLMVPGTPGRSEVNLPASGWIDVPRRTGDPGRGHFVGDEAGPLMHLLDLIDAQRLGVYVITPYRDVDAGLQRRLEGTAHGAKVTQRRVGTVHTFQGREEDVVVVVLGGRGSLRAREFTHDKPNFLNVAITRAKRRLYVIGDRTTWAPLPFFEELDKVLSALELERSVITG